LESLFDRSSGRPVETGVHAAPLGSIEIVAKLLTVFPICTTTGSDRSDAELIVSTDLFGHIIVLL
jgi:hypothetical protein